MTGVTVDTSSRARSPALGLRDLVLAHNWSVTPLGPRHGWSRSLHAVVELTLGSPIAMCVLWGPEQVQVYNDGYAVLAGDRHPAALGQPSHVSWPEAWAIKGPIYDAVLRGEAQSFPAQQRMILRDGRLEGAWFDLTFSPLRDDPCTEHSDGRIAGILLTMVEVTERVRAEQRLRFRLELEQRLRTIGEPSEVLAVACEALGRQIGAGRVACARPNETGTFAVIEREWSDGTLPRTASHGDGSRRLCAAAPRFVRELEAGETIVVADAFRDPRTASPTRLEGTPPGAFINVPLVKDGRLVAIFAAHSALPRGWTAEEVALCEEVAARSWGAVERAEAEAAMRESKARLARAVAAARAGTWDWDPVTDVMTGSAGLEEHLTGRHTGAIRSLAAMLDAVHPEDRPSVQDSVRRVLAGETDEYLAEFRSLWPDGSVRWLRSVGRALRNEGGVLRHLSGVSLDVTEGVEARHRQDLLAREVDHRAKNVLAVVQSIVRLTPAADPVAFRVSVEGRIAALVRAQTLLSEDRWHGADLRALLEGELALFIAGGQRVEILGPPVKLPARAAQPMAMTAHELATNAVKHGALSVPEGRVAISWTVGEPRQTLRLRWVETGGPIVAAEPARRGFGSRVLDGTVRGQLGGVLALDWQPGGLACDIDVPLESRVPTPAGR